jgi:hypothetical protein
MNIRRKIVVALASAAVVAGGVLAVPGLASATHQTAKTHKLTFTAQSLKQHSFSKTSQVEVDKDIHPGNLVTYDILDFKGNVATVSLALKNGFLYGKFTIDTSGNLTGKVTGGSGPYRGAKGTISGHPSPAVSADEAVKVVYHT